MKKYIQKIETHEQRLNDNKWIINIYKWESKYSGMQIHTSPFSNEKIYSKNIHQWTEIFFLKIFYT